MGCVLKDIEKHRSMSASTKPTKKIIFKQKHAPPATKNKPKQAPIKRPLRGL